MKYAAQILALLALLPGCSGDAAPAPGPLSRCRVVLPPSERESPPEGAAAAGVPGEDARPRIFVHSSAQAPRGEDLEYLLLWQGPHGEINRSIRSLEGDRTQAPK